MAELFDMGKYAPFIWPSYGISIAVILAAIVLSLRQRRAMAARLRTLEQQAQRSAAS